MNKQLSPNKEISQFLEDVKEQIQYKPIRAEIEEEMKAHIEDRTLEYIKKGVEEKEAVHRAVEQMGDGTSIGVMLNETRHVKNNRTLVGMVFAAVILGIIGNFIIYEPMWDDGLIYGVSDVIHNLYYFIWGLIVFTIVYYKGYTFLVKHPKLTLNIFVITGLTAMLLSCFNGIFFRYINFPGFRIIRILWSGHVLGFSLLLLSGPILALAAYKFRNKGKNVILLYMLSLLAVILIQYKLNGEFVLSAIVVLLLTSSSTLFTLIYKGLLNYDKKKLFIYSCMGMLAILVIYGTVSVKDQKSNIIQFLSPQDQTKNHWQDSYNGILIKDLLSKAELFGQVRLTKEELMIYGTGAWFFDEEEVNQITKYLHYDEADVTLNDILPQHYHNNYRFAFWILNYGRIPAIILILLVMGIYGVLFFVTSKIHNKLGHILALSCTMSLAVQMMLYLLGNLGYQYGYFSTLPFISEGFCSITINMILVGVILSAYRYDKVIREEKYFNREGKVSKEAEQQVGRLSR